MLRSQLTIWRELRVAMPWKRDSNTMVVTVGGVEIHIREQYRECKKRDCRFCRRSDGSRMKGHGPYFYGWYMQDRKKVTCYIGLNLQAGLARRMHAANHPMREICSTLGISKMTFYRYIREKRIDA
jgi:DNA invertase Pin-like site-specific DNA recombinase